MMVLVGIVLKFLNTCSNKIPELRKCVPCVEHYTNELGYTAILPAGYD